jgi:PAS domain S-box-containing protein
VEYIAPRMDDATSQVRRLRDGLRLISLIVEAFAQTTTDYHSLLRTIARNLAESIPDTCVVMLRSGDHLTPVAIHDAEPDAASASSIRDAMIASQVMVTGPLFMPRIDYAALAEQVPGGAIDKLKAVGATGVLVVPLATRGELIGAVWVVRRGASRPALDELDLEIVTCLATHAALAIGNARLFAQLEHSEQLRSADDGAVQASSLLDAIVENVPEMVFVKEAETLSFVRLNRAGEELLGLRRDELIGKTDFDLFPRSEAEFFVAKDRETLRSGSLVDIREEPIHTRRGLRWLHTKKVPLIDSAGRPRYLLGISHDITAYRQVVSELSSAKSAAEVANRELEAFSYSVAHDLRTPLRAIDGFSQALVEEYGDRLDGEGTRYLARVREAAQRMAELIDDLLTLSRVARTELRRDRVDLSALATTLIATYQRLEPARAVEIVVAPSIVADADLRMVSIALDNLLGNAWKFTSKTDGARIELGTTTQGGASAFFVRDNGVGFDMDYVDKLFGVFQRLHPETEYPGTGIGLATVARIAHRHHGRVWAEGAPGKGATFYFTLTEHHG